MIVTDPCLLVCSDRHDGATGSACIDNASRRLVTLVVAAAVVLGAMAFGAGAATPALAATDTVGPSAQQLAEDTRRW
jgi:hypothetical protein